jgi:hypothetical protein
MLTRNLSRVVALSVGTFALAGRQAWGTELYVPSPEYPTIQDAIDDCNDGDVVIVAARDPNSPYAGPGFRDLDFGGRAITIRSESGPTYCKIDCQGDQYNSRRAFHFHNGETSSSAVQGLWIVHGYADAGGAILCDASSPRIVNCTFESNTTVSSGNGGGAIACINGAAPIISSCTIGPENRAWASGSAGGGGGICCTSGSSPVITHCTISDNVCEAGAGGALFCTASSPLLLHSTVTRNIAVDQQWYYSAGQVYVTDASDATIVNCLIVGNRVEGHPGYQGGAIACLSESQVHLSDCTIADNSIVFEQYLDESAGLMLWGDAVLNNCVFWNNTGVEIWVVETNSLVVSYSDMDGGWSGTGNINANPRFVSYPDPNSPFAGDYYLAQLQGQGTFSPCVNAGQGVAAQSGLARYTTRTDQLPDGDTVDMGYHYPGDCNGNGDPDPVDIDSGVSHDCNLNAVPDECDIASGTSLDDPNDGVPDECQGYPDGRNFTVNADFEDGTLINLDPNTPAADQLQRCTLARPLPYLWVPVSGRGTVALLYTGNDAAIGPTGKVLGEYYTAQANPGSSPSRTSVDLDGRVWVGNREDSWGAGGTVAQVGFVVGGTRCNALGGDDPNGAFLKPPFRYNTCRDRNGDGLIKTSRGLGDVLPWAMDEQGTAAAAEDECICRSSHVAGDHVRFVAVDRTNGVWTGGFSNFLYQRVDGETGFPGDIFDLGVGGYGGLVDGNDVLWSSQRDPSQLVRWYDLTNPDAYTLVKNGSTSSDSYGLGIDSLGNIWNAQYNAINTRGQVWKFGPAGNYILQRDLGTGSEWRGVAVTLVNDDVWVARSNGSTVSRARPSGVPVTYELGTSGSSPRGLAVDQDGFVWAACYYADTVIRIDPNSPDPNSPSLLTVDLDPNAAPYAMGGMTGQVTLHTSGTGTWNVIHDGGRFGADWHLVMWNRDPNGPYDPNCPNDPNCPYDPNDLTVAVRAADLQAQLTSQAWVSVRDGERFNDVKGKFIEIRVRFVGSRPGQTYFSPTVCDLSVTWGIGDMNCDGTSGYISFGDINPFVLAVSNASAYAAAWPRCDIMFGDINGDGTFGFDDINPFVALLSEP